MNLPPFSLIIPIFMAASLILLTALLYLSVTEGVHPQQWGGGIAPSELMWIEPMNPRGGE